MPERPEPYLTHAAPARWSGWTFAATFVLYAIYMATGRHPTWERPLFFLFGLVFLAVAIDGVRTREATFDWGVWIHWRAQHSERPVCFWLLTLLNFALGVRVMWLALFGRAP